MSNKTRRDEGAAPTRRDEAASPTRHDSVPAAVPGATRLDTGAPGVTHRDVASQGPRRSLFNLPSTFDGRYRIVEPLPTAGAEAELLIVESVEAGHRAVAKLYRPGIEPKTEVLKRISQAAPQYVVRLIEHGQSDGIWYELLEYCRFGSLRRFLHGRPIPEAWVERFLIELFEAIDYLHGTGIIHRDLKPENVLIRQTEPLDLVLTDFGIASVTDSSQHFTSASRTVKYGAPEAASGVISAKADYWSLGMIIVEALTGRHPFDGLSEQVINQRLATRPVDVSGVSDARWRMLCRGLVHRNPDDRWDAGTIRRWLRRDPELAIASDDAQAMQSAMPYVIEDDYCSTPQELGIALAKHWSIGVKDLARGFIAGWVRDELKDLNLSRFLIDLADETSLTPDARLLRLVLKLAPDLPAIWRGEALTDEHLAAAAARAVSGDAAAADWIKQLFEQQVLKIYAATGATRLAEILRECEQRELEARGHLDRLLNAQREFEHARAAAWRQNDRPPDMDELMFGRELHPAATVPLYPDLLLLCLIPEHATALRSQILARSVEFASACPWYGSLGDIAALDAAQLLALKAAAPRAETAVRQENERREQAQRIEHGRVVDFSAQLNALLEEMRAMENAGFSRETDGARSVLAEHIASFRELDSNVSLVPITTKEGVQLRENMTRARFVINGLERQLDHMRGWLFNIGTAGGAPFVVTAIIGSMFEIRWLTSVGEAALFGALCWYGWFRWRAVAELRRLIRRLPRPAETAGIDDR
ncbi:MAG: serine/threonine-protein kinase [Pseudomonadota bacterium]